MSRLNTKRREWRHWLEAVRDQMLDVDERHAFNAFGMGFSPNDYVISHNVRLRAGGHDDDGGT